MKHLFRILILLVTVASARGATVANLFTTNSSPGVDFKGNIRLGSNSSASATMPHGTNGILIGSFGAGDWVTGNGIYIGGANGGGADIESIAIGQGAGAADGAGGPSAGSIAIGNQTDSFGIHSVTIGYANVGMFSDFTICIGSGNSTMIADNSSTNNIYIGNSMGAITGNNNTVIGSSISSTALIFGKITGNGNGLTNINTTNLTWTAVSTNFISGFIYTNFYGVQIQVSINIRATIGSAAGGGDAQMDLQQPAGTFIKRVGSGAAATLVAQTNNFDMSYVVPVNGTYCFTSTITTGTGYSVSVNSGQIFVY